MSPLAQQQWLLRGEDVNSVTLLIQPGSIEFPLQDICTKLATGRLTALHCEMVGCRASKGWTRMVAIGATAANEHY
jgi:hypothetical protein